VTHIYDEFILKFQSKKKKSTPRRNLTHNYIDPSSTTTESDQAPTIDW